MGQGQSAPKKSLFDTVIEVKLVKKRLESAHKKCQKEELKEKQKIAKAIRDGHAENARIYAQNAIRKKNEGIQMLRLAAKMDAVASRLDTAQKTQEITSTIRSTVPQLEKALKNVTPEAMAKDMDKFEKIFDDLDVRTNYITSAVDSTTATTTPQGEVDQLIQAVGEEHAMNVDSLLKQDPLSKPISAVPQANKENVAPAANADNDLEARFAMLRGQ